MRLRKLEAYDEFKTLYPDTAVYYVKQIEDKVDELTLEYVLLLAEICYKEGYKDGYRFADWLHEKTK